MLIQYLKGIVYIKILLVIGDALNHVDQALV